MTSLILLSQWNESQIEFWRKIEGFPGYDVSSKGRVRSWWRRGFRKGHRGYVTERSPVAVILKFGKHRQGYLTAYLYLGRGHSRRQIPVHRLVAVAFTSNPERLPEVNHLCALKSDNRAEGLEWSSRLGNQQHANGQGLITRPKGVQWFTEKHQATLTFSPDSVREVRSRAANGEKQGDIAKDFGVAANTISRIVRRKRWAHVE